MHSNKKVDWYFNQSEKWYDELKKLRSIVLNCGLAEELKWGVPCYTSDKANIVLIHVFKEYCAILFFKGSLLKNPDGILVQQTKNVQAARQIRFSGVDEIIEKEALTKAYIQEAIELEKSGVKVEMKTTNEFNMPPEFLIKLNKSAALKKAFQALTPGRQRGYLLYFSAAKQSATREARVEKWIPEILKGNGIND